MPILAGLSVSRGDKLAVRISTWTTCASSTTTRQNRCSSSASARSTRTSRSRKPEDVFPRSGRFRIKGKFGTHRLGCFGGIKDSHFVIAAGWTVSGSDPRDLDEWRDPATPPADGWVDLRNRYLIEPGVEPPYFSLDLPEPDPALRERAFSAYIDNLGFEEQVRNAHRGALMICKRNPPTLDETRAQTLAAEYVLFGLWGPLANRHAFAAGELEGILSPIIDRAVDIAGKYGIPLIQRQLKAGAGPD